jgi:hypothetical protein
VRTFFRSCMEFTPCLHLGRKNDHENQFTRIRFPPFTMFFLQSHEKDCRDVFYKSLTAWFFYNLVGFETWS